jgi:hypothetical protein
MDKKRLNKQILRDLLIGGERMLLPNLPMKTLGGPIWWVTLEEQFGWKLQKHILTEHFRILDFTDLRQAWSFDEAAIRLQFHKFTTKNPF